MGVLALVVNIVVSIPLSALAILIIYLIYMHTKYGHLPGPERDGFFTGNLPMVRRRRRQDKVIIHQIWSDVAVQYSQYPLYVFWFMHRPVVIISDAVLVKEILIKLDLHKDPYGYSHFAYLFGQRLLGGSLLSEVDHQAWKQKRTCLNPAFHRKYLGNLIDQFNLSSDLFLEKLAKVADGETEVSMAEEFVRLALDVVGKVAYDLDVDSINSPYAPIPSSTRLALEGLVQSFRRPFSKYQPSTYAYQRKCIEAVKYLRSASKGVIEARIDAVKKGEDSHSDILSYMLKIAEEDPETTIDDLVDHFMTFIVGGQETTSNHIAFALLGILLHPEVEEKVIAEVDEVLGSHQYITNEHLSKLTYLDQTIKEALRLHPPQPAISRITKEDTKLGDYMIPAGTSVMIDPHVLHHSPKYWDDPEKYDPERFNAENKSKIEHYAYFPFSLGAHNCIGMAFAQMETKLVLARTFQTFKMALTPGQELKAVEQMTVRPKDGVRVTIGLR